jgi:hypothetical protein
MSNFDTYLTKEGIHIEDSRFYGFIYDNDDVLWAEQFITNEHLYIYIDNACSKWADMDFLSKSPKLNLVELYDAVVDKFPELHQEGIREICKNYGQI